MAPFEFAKLLMQFWVASAFDKRIGECVIIKWQIKISDT